MKLKKKVGAFFLKIGIKQQAIKFDLKVSKVIREFINCLRLLYIPILLKHRTRNGVLAIKLDSDWIGLGARMVATIELLMYAEEKSLQLQMGYGYKNKYDLHNYFDDLFESNILNVGKYTRVKNIQELKLAKDYNKLLTITSANRLLKKYLNVRQNIQDEVDTFTKAHFDGLILGLHYRGTDKVGEAPKVELEFIYELILETLKKSEIKYTKLFISSDETICLDFFKSRKLPIEIIWRDDIYRSADGNQFHRNPANNLTTINQEALVNCLLLSKCDLLIKTASILSDCCKIFNPELKMIILNTPYSSNLTWWPAKELNEKYLYRPNKTTFTKTIPR